MGKYIIAPPAGSQTNALGAKNRPWEEVHANRYPGINEYLTESTGYGIVSGCEPSINGLTVTVSAGVIHTADGRRVEVPEQSITLDAADASNPRIDIVNLERIVKLSATPLRNRPHMVFCSQGTFWGASSAHGTSVGCNPPAYP